MVLGHSEPALANYSCPIERVVSDIDLSRTKTVVRKQCHTRRCRSTRKSLADLCSFTRGQLARLILPLAFARTGLSLCPLFRGCDRAVFGCRDRIDLWRAAKLAAPDVPRFLGGIASHA